MYWTPAKMLLLADVGEYSFENAGLLSEAEWCIYASGNYTIIDSDNGLSPERRQAIIWTNVSLLLIKPLGTNFSGIWIIIQTVLFKKMHFKMSSAKWQPFCLGFRSIISPIQIGLGKPQKA